MNLVLTDMFKRERKKQLEELDAKLERSYLDDEDERPSMIGPRVCYQACCKNYDSSDIYDKECQIFFYTCSKLAGTSIGVLHYELLE